MSLNIEANNKFWKAMDFVAEMEGLYSNHPADSGGATKWGISDNRDGKKDGFIQVDKETFVPAQDLQLSSAISIYWKDYWFPIHGNDLDMGMAIAAFDSAVQHGVPRTLRWMNKVDDWRRLISLRRIFYLDLIQKNPEKAVFKNGWMKRLNELEKYISLVTQEEQQELKT